MTLNNTLLLSRIKGNIYDPVNNFKYVEDTKVSVSIKKN